VTNEVTRENPSSEGVTNEVTRDQPATVTDLDSRRSDESRPQSAADWLLGWMTANAGPDGWVKPADALAAGKQAGHNAHAIIKAKRLYADPPIESSGKGRESQWRIVPIDTEDAS
jgi:hypothetical protein